MYPEVNQIYRHFKGNLYRVITVAVHTETEEELVVYQALYGDFKVYARPMSMFMSEVDKEKYPDVMQKMRFEPINQMVTTPISAESEKTDWIHGGQQEDAVAESVSVVQSEDRKQELLCEEMQSVRAEAAKVENLETEAVEENTFIDPMLEAYLDTDSYRERLNILHGLQHRITEHMLNTMAIVIDFELPEGDIQTKYDALNDCLLTKEKYECNRMF